MITDSDIKKLKGVFATKKEFKKAFDQLKPKEDFHGDISEYLHKKLDPLLDHLKN